MPLTPFHLGPGAALKAALGARLSFAVFAFSQFLIDVEPVLHALLGSDRLHAHLHTYAGATVVAIVSALAGRPACEWALRLWNSRLDTAQARWLGVPANISRGAAWSGAFVGAYSHVAIDSIMHADMTPLAPFAADNPLFGWLSGGEVEALCVALGALALAALGGLRAIRKDRSRESA